jgi:hypothetical protein
MKKQLETGDYYEHLNLYILPNPDEKTKQQHWPTCALVIFKVMLGEQRERANGSEYARRD